MMTTKFIPICGEHQTPKAWRPITFDYMHDGVTLYLHNVHAWVCPIDGEASFTPETVDELIRAVQAKIQFLAAMQKVADVEPPDERDRL